MKLASLFSGIGGFELGFQGSGIATDLMCELDPAARAVLTARFPHIELAGDVRQLPDLPKSAEILAAGFPCQDLSSVGGKDGIWGTKSGLVSEVFRLVELSRPQWVVIENVYFMLHLNGGAGMTLITDRLEALGYNWAYRVLDTIGFGLPQRRRRVFFVASRDEDPRAVLLSDSGELEGVDVSLSEPVGFYWTEGTYAAGLTSNGIPPLKSGSTIGIPSPPAILKPSGLVGTPQIADAEALQGFARGWTDVPDIGRPSMRWRLVGNAVSVPVAEWLGSKFAAPVTYRGNEDAVLPKSARWPESGWSLRGDRRGCHVGAHPSLSRAVALEKFLHEDLKPLSWKATAGFLKRARKGNLRFPAGFLDRIEEHMAAVS